MLPPLLMKGTNGKKRRRRKKKKWTKPVGKPKRPLSAYNLFFAEERILMLGKDIPTPEQEALKKKVHCKTHGKISFAVMARTIGAKWKALGFDAKKTFEDRARKLKAKYLVELSEWKESQKEGVLPAAGSNGGGRGVQVTSSPNVAARINPIPNSEVARYRSDSVAMAPPDTNVESLLAQRSMPLSRGIEDSNLTRLILQHENRRRYLSLLQGNTLADYDFSQVNRNWYNPQINQALLHHGLSRRPSAPGADPFSASGSLQHNFDNTEHGSVDRMLLSDLQGLQNPATPKRSSQYLQALEEYTAMLRLQQNNRYGTGGFNGSSNNL